MSQNKKSKTPSLLEQFKKAISTKKSTAFMRLIAKHGADVSLDETGINPLMLAAYHGESYILNQLIKSGAELNNEDNSGNTALIMAVKQNQPACLSLLLDAGAKIEQQNNQRMNALMLAAGSSHLQCLNLLLKAGARVNATGPHGPTALMYAAEQGHQQCVTVLLESGASINIKTHQDFGALFYAAIRGHLEVCRILLTWGAPLSNHEAQQFRFANTVKIERRREIVTLINEQRATIRYQFSNLGYSSFMSDLYSKLLPEQTLCQRLITDYQTMPTAEYQTANGTNLLRASAILNKPKLLFTAALVVSNHDLLLAADILSSLKLTLEYDHHRAVSVALLSIKIIQQNMPNFSMALQSEAIMTSDYLPDEIYYREILPKVFNELEFSDKPWFERLILGILKNKSTIKEKILATRTINFADLPICHPLLITAADNFYYHFYRLLQIWQRKSFSSHAPLFDFTEQAIFEHEPMASLPAHILWHRSLMAHNPSKQVAMLLNLLKQHHSPWLKSAAPLIWQHLSQTLTSPLKLDDATVFARSFSQLATHAKTTAISQGLASILMTLNKHQSAAWLKHFYDQCSILLNQKLPKVKNTPQSAINYYLTTFPEHFNRETPVIKAMLAGAPYQTLQQHDWQPFVDGLCNLLSDEDYTDVHHDAPELSDGDYDYDEDYQEIVEQRIDDSIEITERATPLLSFLSHAQLQQLTDATHCLNATDSGSDEFTSAFNYAITLKLLTKFRGQLTIVPASLKDEITYLIDNYPDYFQAEQPFIQALLNEASNSELVTIDKSDFVESLFQLLTSEHYYIEEGYRCSDDDKQKNTNTLCAIAAFLPLFNLAILQKIIDILPEDKYMGNKIYALRQYAQEIKYACAEKKLDFLSSPALFRKHIQAFNFLQAILRGQEGLYDKKIENILTRKLSYHDYHIDILQALRFLVDNRTLTIADAKALFSADNSNYNMINSSLTLLEHIEQQHLPCAKKVSDKTKAASNTDAAISTLLKLPVKGDGHCLFNAVALYTGNTVEQLRTLVVETLINNIEHYQPYIELQAGQTIEDYVDGLMTNQWVGHLEIELLMRVLNRPIIVITPQNVLHLERIREFNGDYIFVQYNGRDHYDGLIMSASTTVYDTLQALHQFNAEHQQPLRATANPSPFFAATSTPKERGHDKDSDIQQRRQP